MGTPRSDERLAEITDYYAGTAPEFVSEATARERAREVVERQQEWQISDGEAERRRETGHRELARHLDPEAVLDAVDDERIREYATGLGGVETTDDD